MEEEFQNRMPDVINQTYSNQNSFYRKVIEQFGALKRSERKKRMIKQLFEKHFVELTKDYLKADVVKQMDENIQHGSTTTLEHCENVAWISYLINKKLNLKADEKELVEAAILHDFYLYDWHDKDHPHKPHGFTHPFTACNNAVKYFGISEKQQEAIRSHMWPLNITTIPKSREALIICLADKYCAIAEIIRLNKRLGLRR